MPQLAHALEDVLLADDRALPVDHRVVGRRGLGQTGQHGRLRHAELIERLVEVDRRGRRETVGAFAQVDLVHVQLQNLVLAVNRFELVGQHDLHDLAAIGFLPAQEEDTRDLHGDGAGSLGMLAGHEVAERGAGDARVVHRPVFVVPGVLDGEQGLPHRLRDPIDRHELAPLFAVLGEQAAVPGMNAHGEHGLVVGQMAHLGHLLPQAVQGMGRAEGRAHAQPDGQCGEEPDGEVGPHAVTPTFHGRQRWAAATRARWPASAAPDHRRS